MVFSSFTFLFLFLPITVLLYFSVKSRSIRNLVLLISSLVFYAWGEPIYIFFIIFSTAVDYIFSNLVQYIRDKGKAGWLEKLCFWTSICINIGLLGYFKYSGFIVENINMLFGSSIEFIPPPLPIGISFYTFQTMSYSIDVYLGKLKAQKNILTLATYVSFFPQLIAGPIVRYATIEDELSNRKESFDDIASGIRRFIFGLAKKVILANNLGLIADNIFSIADTSGYGFYLWVGAVAFSLQIYFDFSGYSDMAIGLGRIFGFHFLENFNYPFMAKSVSDFWRRWHMSLTTWFRDYVYIPLGGNKKHRLRNIFLVWLLTGIWHGANYNYIIWGMYFFIIIIIEKIVIDKSKSDNYCVTGCKIKNLLYASLQRLFIYGVIAISFVIFKIEDLGKLGNIIIDMFSQTTVPKDQFIFMHYDILHVFPFIIIGIVASVDWNPLYDKIRKKFEYDEKKLALFDYASDGGLLLLFMVTIMFLLGSSFNPFIYFRF